MKRKNIEKCRDLRKNQTDAEKKLWTMLRNRQIEGVKFRRQFAISNYIVDFYCPELKFGVEVDGGEHHKAEYLKRDLIRTRQLARHDIEIIRFSNNEVLNHIEGKSPSPSSSPRGERKLIRKYSLLRREANIIELSQAGTLSPPGERAGVRAEQKRK